MFNLPENHWWIVTVRFTYKKARHRRKLRVLAVDAHEAVYIATAHTEVLELGTNIRCSKPRKEGRLNHEV